MNINISKRNFIRIISFVLAIILSLGLYSVNSNGFYVTASTKLEQNYVKSINSLSDYMVNIENSLVKIMYSNSITTINDLSATLWKEASFAKDTMSTLPLSELNLENTYKYLAQVGDYAMSLAQKTSSGEEITDEERANLQTLHEYSYEFLNQILILQDGVNTGYISLANVYTDYDTDDDEQETSTSFSDTFTEFEGGFSSYPSLVYNGPFSDHILEQEPVMLSELEEISQEEAEKIASSATGVSVDFLEAGYDEEGNMPSYVFQSGDTTVAITKNGGLLSYVLKYRAVEQATLSAEECISFAEEYLSKLGISSLKETYYEISGNSITINFAYEQDGIICYTDLIKVTIAMDNGEILSYDGRGYITNHYERDDMEVSISEQEARENLSSLLEVLDSKLCIIPSSNVEQTLCYEFTCTSENHEDILVYINAKTGYEEQILILYIDEKGTLTK